MAFGEAVWPELRGMNQSSARQYPTGQRRYLGRFSGNLVQRPALVPHVQDAEHG
jgi:hypothetical protein